MVARPGLLEVIVTTEPETLTDATLGFDEETSYFKVVSERKRPDTSTVSSLTIRI